MKRIILYTVHQHYPGLYQTSIYDYEGWAHSYPEGWTPKRGFRTLDDARKYARGKRLDEKSYITDTNRQRFALSGVVLPLA